MNALNNSKMGKPSIFGHDSSDSEEEGEGDWVQKSLKVKANNSGLKKQAKIQMAKALEEDPTVFQYDEVYDDIERKKEVEKESKKDVDRKPKYVHNLLKAADERQKEFERRIERQVCLLELYFLNLLLCFRFKERGRKREMNSLTKKVLLLLHIERKWRK